MLACSALADDQLPTADLLIPQNEGDYSNLLAALMDQQHKVLTTTLGADHPQVALASTLVDLQTTVRLHPLVIFQSWLVLHPFGCKQLGS